MYRKQVDSLLIIAAFFRFNTFHSYFTKHFYIQHLIPHIAVSNPLFVCLSHSPSFPSLVLPVSAPLSLRPVSLIRNPVKIAQAKQGGFDQALISTVDSVSAHPDSTEPWSTGAPDSSSSTPRHQHPKGLMMHHNLPQDFSFLYRLI